jgi:hypothetical protein
MSVSAPATKLTEEILKALLQDYATARQEVILHVQLYKTQERYGAVIIGLLGLLFPVLLGTELAQLASKSMKDLGPGALLLGLFTTSTILFHMYFTTLANLFALQVLAERCVLLQDEINKCLDKSRHLVWERLTKLIWSKDGIPTHKMPDRVAGMFSFLLVAALGFALPLWLVSNTLAKLQIGPLFVLAVFYIWYLFAAGAFAIVNFLAVASVRDECHHLFKNALDTGLSLKKLFISLARLRFGRRRRLL